MELTIISRATFYLRTIQYRIGNLGLLGLLMLIAAAILYLTLILPQVRRLHSVDAAYAKLKLLTQNTQAVKQHTPQQLLSSEAFFRQFPEAAQKDEALKTIITIAEKNTLPLDTGKYETIIKESGQTVFYQISFPLKGSYLQIKQFLATTLNNLPNAALSRLLLHQTFVDSNQIEADVIFTLYFNKAA